MAMKRPAEFAVGDGVLVDGAAVVSMETATQVLVHIEERADDEWIPKKSARLVKAGAAEGDSVALTSRQVETEDADGSREEDDECFVCGNGGKLTCCDVCPRVYHLRCLPAVDVEKLRQPSRNHQKSTDEDWWCPRCRRISRLTFCMYGILGQMRGTEPSDVWETASQLFEFMSDPQHDRMWGSLREAGTAMLAEMGGSSSHWESRGGEILLSAGDPLETRSRLDATAWQGYMEEEGEGEGGDVQSDARQRRK